MAYSKEDLENYLKNLLCLREVTGELLSYMKGHDYSFRSQITDRKGNFSREKLHSLVEELLSGWVEKLREDTDTDPVTGESLAEPYFQARRELYGLYLHLTMRCSLCEGAYARAGGTGKERADFAYLLEQVQRLSRSWCVMSGADGEKTNALYQGFDAHFGFHLYHVLTDPEGGSPDKALTPYWKAPMERLADMTNEGNMKRIYLKGFTAAPAAAASEQPDQTTCAEDADYGDPEGYDSTEDSWDLSMDRDLPVETAADENTAWLAALAVGFEDREEYLAACERFKALFEKASPEILRDFPVELEEMVNLYLLRQGLAPLSDTDKTLDVYSRIYDGSRRQARLYERGLQWNRL